MVYPADAYSGEERRKAFMLDSRARDRLLDMRRDLEKEAVAKVALYITEDGDEISGKDALDKHGGAVTGWVRNGTWKIKDQNAPASTRLDSILFDRTALDQEAAERMRAKGLKVPQSSERGQYRTDGSAGWYDFLPPVPATLKLNSFGIHPLTLVNQCGYFGHARTLTLGPGPCRTEELASASKNQITVAEVKKLLAQGIDINVRCC